MHHGAVLQTLCWLLQNALSARQLETFLLCSACVSSVVVVVTTLTFAGILGHQFDSSTSQRLMVKQSLSCFVAG